MNPLRGSVMHLLSLPVLSLAFQAPCPILSGPGSQGAAVQVARQPAGQLRAAAESQRTVGLGCGTAFAALAVVVAGAKRQQQRRRGATRCQALSFSSSGSGFMGEPATASFPAMQTEPDSNGYESRCGVAGMAMKNQVWYIKNTGFDGRSGKIYDSRRRESRRRGEELFRHDTDTFELTQHNLVPAPGSRIPKIRRGRGKYGHHGRTCGYGNGGAHKRGRRTINPGYEGGHVPLHLRVPILTKEQRQSMAADPYTPIPLSVLNYCEPGDKVDFEDLFLRGLPVEKKRGYSWTKVKGTPKDEFTVQNLTVYANAFEPVAREKIEMLGGKCVRLHEWSGLPMDEEATKILAVSDGEEEEEEAPASEEEE